MLPWHSALRLGRSSSRVAPLQFVVDFVPDNIFAALSDGGRMLQVIFFAVFFGLVLIMIPRDQAQPVIDFVNGGQRSFP
jgi:Na+/H+-dicarboxylate symporter